MGGTTAKACLIHGGEPERTARFEVARETRFAEGSGLPLQIPAIDMIEIGAGGGSIAGRGCARAGASWPAKCCGGPWPGLLWQGQRQADRHRLRSGAGLLGCRVIPWRNDGIGCGGGRGGDPHTFGRTARRFRAGSGVGRA